MARLSEYIPFIETGFFGEGAISAEGFVAIRFEVEATGTAGIHGQAELPCLDVNAEGHQENAGAAKLPGMQVHGYVGTIAQAEMPCLEVNATAREFVYGDNYLPSLNVAGKALCGLAWPFSGGDTVDEILSLLGHDSPEVVSLADTITLASAEGEIEIVYDIWKWVTENIEYQTDLELTGIEEFHACPMATVEMGAGDCEDGALLMHALMLAKGVDTNNLRTAWGVINQGAGDLGHVWTMYRRPNDGEWVVLEWTSGNINAQSIYSAPLLQDSTDEYLYIYRYATWRSLVEYQGLTSTMEAAGLNLGNATLPMLGVDGYASNRGEGETEFPGIRVAAYAGAHGDVGLPGLQVSAHAILEHVAHGNLELPALTVLGRTGTVGNVTLPTIEVSAHTSRGNALGDIKLAVPTVQGSAVVHNSATGTLRLPRLKGGATGKQDHIATGDIVLPSLHVRGKATLGVLSYGDINLPIFQVQALGFLDLYASGVMELPSLDLIAQASHMDRFDNALLRYERWPIG